MPQAFMERRQDYTDPEGSQEVYQAQYEKHCADFLHGRISVHVFRAYLFSLKFKPDEIENEVSLNWPLVKK